MSHTMQQHAALLGYRKNRENPKTFSIYLSNRQRKKGLTKNWLETAYVFVGKHNITTQDGTVWPLYLEEATKAELQSLPYLQRIVSHKCLVSFQVFNDGEFFAVARLYKDNKEKDKPL